MKCHTCGEPTRIVSRRITFFGLDERYSKWCRPHLAEAAAEAGLPVADVLADYDMRIVNVKAAKEAYARRKGEGK